MDEEGEGALQVGEHAQRFTVRDRVTEPHGVGQEPLGGRPVPLAQRDPGGERQSADPQRGWRVGGEVRSTGGPWPPAGNSSTV
ncbi:hypothetical protein ACGFSB_27025 [Streptomyces sp. NPDC048441]|uniref:hypothetical protein n=1 Tax=Streptomyces sp. NPDC048441 TaxID=3365552 RepID=UPI0037111FFE